MDQWHRYCTWISGIGTVHVYSSIGTVHVYSSIGTVHGSSRDWPWKFPLPCVACWLGAVVLEQFHQISHDLQILGKLNTGWNTSCMHACNSCILPWCATAAIKC